MIKQYQTITKVHTIFIVTILKISNVAFSLLHEIGTESFMLSPLMNLKFQNIKYQYWHFVINYNKLV